MDGLTTIQELFASRCFRIPTYQRGYSWEMPHWDDLLEDLEVLPEGKDHFAGQMVLQPTDDHLVDREGSRFQMHDVVDGQQRLTTLTLLLDAVRRFAGPELASGIRRRYVEIENRARGRRTMLTFTDGSQSHFQERVLADHPAAGGAQMRSEQRMSECLEHFMGYLREQADGRGDGFASWAESLHDRITQQVRVNLFTVTDPSEVGLIFEVVNSRGRPLSDLDLVKNYVLYVGTKLDLEHALHDDVADAWSRILTGMMNAGVIAGADEDQLLRAHWLMAYDYQRRNWDGHRSIKAEFRLRKYVDRHTDLLADLRHYVMALRDAAVVYVDIRNPTRTDAFADMSDTQRPAVKRASEQLLRTRAVAVFVPLLIAVRLRHPGDSYAYLHTVELAERYAFRVYRLLGRRADAGEAALARAAWQLHRGDIDLDEALEEVRLTLLSYCPQRRFEEVFSADASWYRWSGLKYLLYEYEQHLVGPDPADIRWEVIDRADKEKTIEHVLPQTPQAAYWLERFGDEDRERYTHDLGNLVLTADNSSYGRKPFPDKKGSPGLGTPCYANANLRSERELVNWTDWTPESVLQRREKLVAWALQRWAVLDLPAETPTHEDTVLALDDDDI